MTSYKTYFNWSTGKDAALAFHYLSQNKEYDIQRLLTSVNAHHNRVSMHGLMTSNVPFLSGNKILPNC